MDGMSLLHRAWTAGLLVDAKGGRLTVRGPRELEPLARELLANKRSVLQALSLVDRVRHVEGLPADWHFLWDERAAILEYEAGMPQSRAEFCALVDILEQMRRPHDGSGKMLA
jgi:hypothetical protein